MTALVAVLRHSKQEAGTDAARKGLLALLSGLTIPVEQGRSGGYAHTHGSRTGLFSVLQLVSGVVVPLLEERHPDTQVCGALWRCYMITANHHMLDQEVKGFKLLPQVYQAARTGLVLGDSNPLRT
jgi:hypothetical protein